MMDISDCGRHTWAVTKKEPGEKVLPRLSSLSMSTLHKSYRNAFTQFALQYLNLTKSTSASLMVIFASSTSKTEI